MNTLQEITNPAETTEILDPASTIIRGSKASNSREVVVVLKILTTIVTVDEVATDVTLDVVGTSIMMTMDQLAGHKVAMVHHQEVTREEEHQTMKSGHETATRISISDNRIAKVSGIK